MVWSRLPGWLRNTGAHAAFLVLALLTTAGLPAVQAREAGGFSSREREAFSHATPAGNVESLPPQAHETMRLIRAGGPFPFVRDGVVFGNRERLLAPQKRGYYREYTVPTPRARDRGARRIVCGGPASAPERCFYSGDHYASFREIAIGR